MNWIAEDAISLLMFLAPGLFAVAVFRSLTSYPPSSLFDQIVQALIFTIVVQVACWGIVDKFETGNGKSGPTWTNLYPPYISLPLSIFLGILLAVTYGKDKIHAILRWFGVTRESSFPSEWYSAFNQQQRCFVILYLTGKRCVYGWPEEWPSQPDKGHFKLSEYAWLTKKEVDKMDTSEYSMRKHLEQFPSRASILIPALDVGMVEFIGVLPEDKNERG